ncbi:MAG: hypothetical protein KA758_03970 [Acidimicrobiales bacterium]|nr:hypothetical protein [Acidimicrobiales bacterium]
MASYEEQKAAQNAEARQWVVFGCKVTGGFVVGIFLISAAWGIISPRLNLYRANTEKHAVIAEQKAKSEAAEYAARSQVTQAQAKADAEVIRARGLAESQDIIASTLTEEYLRYLYIDALAGGNGQIIYVPTEAGLPILEAGRAVTE